MYSVLCVECICGKRHTERRVRCCILTLPEPRGVGVLEGYRVGVLEVCLQSLHECGVSRDRGVAVSWCVSVVVPRTTGYKQQGNELQPTAADRSPEPGRPQPGARETGDRRPVDSVIGTLPASALTYFFVASGLFISPLYFNNM